MRKPPGPLNDQVLGDPDPVRTAMAKAAVPWNREKYLEFAFFGQHPDGIPPDRIPEEFRTESEKRILLARAARAGSRRM